MRRRYTRLLVESPPYRTQTRQKPRLPWHDHTKLTVLGLAWGSPESEMRKEYDFSKSRKNPYAKQLKRQVTIRLDIEAVAYFKQVASELGMPYQNLINLFLRDCAMQKRRPVIQ